MKTTQVTRSCQNVFWGTLAGLQLATYISKQEIELEPRKLVWNSGLENIHRIYCFQKFKNRKIFGKSNTERATCIKFTNLFKKHIHLNYIICNFTVCVIQRYKFMATENNQIAAGNCFQKKDQNLLKYSDNVIFKFFLERINLQTRAGKQMKKQKNGEAMSEKNKLTSEMFTLQDQI